MTSDPDRPGFNDLVTPFIFVKHGDPDPVEWKRAHPGWVSFPATFIPHKRPTPKWTVLNGRRWPLDKRGQPWPRSRFGQPMCPLDEFPPGVPAPGTQGKLQEAQAAALRETVELVGRGELTVEWFLAEGARHRAERDARAAADPQPPLAYAVDGLEPARDYLAWSRHMNARRRGLAEAAGQRVGTADPHPAYDGDGLGVVREHLAMMRKVDAYLREFAAGARQRTAARQAAADGTTDASPAKLDATRASSGDEQASPDAPGVTGVGSVLSDSDRPATHLPDGTPLLRVADKRTYYGLDSIIVPRSPANQALVRDTERAAKALGNGPGLTPTPPLPPPAPFPITPSQPGIEALPADGAASRPSVLSTPQAPVLPTVTAGDELDPQQVIIMEANRNQGLIPALQATSRRARGIVRVSDRNFIAKAGLTEADWRAHHLIPHEAVRDNVGLFQAAARAGYRIDNPGNLILLPYTKTAQEKMRAAGQHRPIHNSGHDKWNSDRVNEVQRISEQVEAERIL